jgi:transposase
VKRLAEVPGLGVDSAQQIIAEVGATTAVFPSEKHLSSWVGRLIENTPHVVVAHRQCRLIWKILHQGVRYEERIRSRQVNGLPRTLMYRQV